MSILANHDATSTSSSRGRGPRLRIFWTASDTHRADLAAQDSMYCLAASSDWNVLEPIHLTKGLTSNQYPCSRATIRARCDPDSERATVRFGRVAWRSKVTCVMALSFLPKRVGCPWSKVGDQPCDVYHICNLRVCNGLCNKNVSRVVNYVVVLDSIASTASGDTAV